ncbi:hypothetical protein MKW94_002508 [Papaver nudicaule]|uniref:Piwi domain-containing protein n=1 Tax=Papaver nudicaule TaxID=74823 RepID=A0AA41VH47_PAPNU|nr:hypothetical protein [Papaver nudicaule]
MEDWEPITIWIDGVRESQFNQVLNIELDQIIEVDGDIAQKNHHTKFFQKRSPDNIPPGMDYL